MAQGNGAIRTTFTHYLSWVALAVVAGLETGFFYWFRPSLIMAGAALGLGVLCLLLWIPIFVRSSAFSASIYKWIEAQEAAQLAKLETLAADFDELAFDKGRAQLRLLRDKLESLTQVLKRRLDSGEMTYGRYLGMAQEVYGAALDNLHEVAVALRSISTIDPGYLRKRLGELERERQRSNDHERELRALRDRGTLLEDTNKRVAQLMAQNESALTVIDQTSAALAATRTEQGHATLDAETAMAELEQLAGRAGKYAASR
jgi:hypothetical protein